MSISPIQSRAPNPISADDVEESPIPKTEFTYQAPLNPANQSPLPSPLFEDSELNREMVILNAYCEVLENPEFSDDPEAYVKNWIESTIKRGRNNCLFPELAVLDMIRQNFSL